ncbi:hypothetical protein [Roseovarius aestuarii]|uniref:hypothetical protein n=1 Tax=Roseovarius aestuarii TaxID=475083 RepID=UPI000A26A4C5|nr:hypothetical protein [Roseovarius aestuarii]
MYSSIWLPSFALLARSSEKSHSLFPDTHTQDGFFLERDAQFGKIISAGYSMTGDHTNSNDKNI